MTTIASINTAFTATTGALEKGVKRAENVVSGFGKRVRGSFFALPQASSLIHGTLAALGISAFVSKIKSQLDDLGQTFDRSISLGIAPQNLKALEFAGSLAGVSADELSTSLAKMQRNISEAAEGSKAQAEVFKKLGLSADKIKTLAPEDQLGKISDALFKIKSPTDRINAAMEIFGRSGARLLSFLSEGSDGIKRSAEDFARLGGAVSEADFAVADMAGDSLQRMSTAFANLKQNLVVSATPAITLFTDSLAALVGATSVAARSQFSLSRMYFDGQKKAGDFINTTQATLDLFTAHVKRAFGDEEGAKRFERSAKDLMGPFKASDLIEEDWRRIMRDMDAAVARSHELRGVKIGDEADAAAKKGKQVEPAAVEFGTTKAIEAINKAFGTTGGSVKDIAKQQLVEQKKGNDKLEEVKRELIKWGERNAFEAAGIND